MRIPHPVPYQGSKRTLAANIIKCFPGGTKRLIEPFAGSAAVTLAAISQREVEQVWLNDINAPLIELWSSIINEPEVLADRYEKLWSEQLGQERQFYDLIRERFNKSHQPHYFLYLLARCVKASVRYNSRGEFNQSPDNRRRGREPRAMRRDIFFTSALLKGRVLLTSRDYRGVVHEANQKDIVYMDPPYQGVVGKRDPRYIQGIDHGEFASTLDLLNRNNISFIVSYDGELGGKSYGCHLPSSLDLTRIELDGGRSTQATLLGRNETTKESLYISRALMSRPQDVSTAENPLQYSLFGG